MSPRRIAKVLGVFGAVAVAAILAVTVIVVRGHKSSEQLAKRVVGLVPGSLLHAHNFHWTQMKNDHSQWVLKAKDAVYSDDKTSMILIQPELVMVDKEGKQVNLIASSAKLTMDGNHIKNANMTGGLTVHYGDFVLTTDSATFAPDADRLDAPGLVKITGSDMDVTGIGLSGHPKEEVFDLLKQVHTRVTPRQSSGKAKVS